MLSPPASPAAAGPKTVVRVKYALLGASARGSTWVNHMLDSHPCIVSVGEYLMRNRSELSLFHDGPAGVRLVLGRIQATLDGALRERRRRSEEARKCTRMAGGVKLKTVARDVTSRNLRAVSNQAPPRPCTAARPRARDRLCRRGAQLAENGWRVLLLQRRNHLEHVLGGTSRRETGTMHCLKDCDPFSLNTSVKLDCKGTLGKMREWAASKAELDGEFGRWAATKRFANLEYERLLRSPRGWARALRALGFPGEDACLLTTARQKRVQQTQREMIRNWDAFSACVRADGAFGEMLRPDERPRSGPQPRDSVEMCPNGGGNFSEFDDHK